MLARSEYQARCTRCGFLSPEFIRCSSSGIFESTALRNVQSPYATRYIYLRVARSNVICTACGVVHQRTHAVIDYPLSPVLLIIATCVLIVVIVSVASKDFVASITATVLACFVALFSIRMFKSAFAKRLRSKFSNRIAELESVANTCPRCGCDDAVDPSHLSEHLPCPECKHNTLAIVCTFKGNPYNLG